MRIAHLAAGAAGMHCGACVRDAAMARALIERGHEVRIVPLYTPLLTEDEARLPVTDVHLGALNAYLQQVSPLFARLPRPIARLLDHPALLRFISRFAVSTSASQLGPMTVSVLAGVDGRQRVELQRLLRFLREEVRPEVLTITNSMLSGVAPAAKRRLGVPVICGLKGEDGFIDAFPEPHRERAYELLRRNAESIDRFLAPTAAYADRMAPLLDVPRKRIAVVRTALDAAQFRRDGPRPRAPFTVGYLSVITPRKGLHVLTEAFALLAGQDRDVRLRVGGQVLNRRYLAELTRGLRRAGLADRMEVLGEVDEAEKPALLHSLSAFCQPSIEPATLGTTALEAMAAGVPVVAPDEGVFPELVGTAGAGLLFEPRNADALAAALARLMDEPGAADELGAAGASAVERMHAPDVVADALLGVLSDLPSDSPETADAGDGEDGAPPRSP